MEIKYQYYKPYLIPTTGSILSLIFSSSQSRLSPIAQIVTLIYFEVVIFIVNLKILEKLGGS
jgi:hypothetical protein